MTLSEGDETMARLTVNDARVAAALALLVAALVVSCDDPGEIEYIHHMYGTVTDSVSGEPVAFVEVRGECSPTSAGAATDSSGHYDVVFEGRTPPASFKLGFLKSGYRSICVPVGSAERTKRGYRVDAELAPIPETTCLMPFAIVDRWGDVDGDSLYDPGEPYDPEITGFQVPADVGLQLNLEAWSPAGGLRAESYLLAALPPLGGDIAPQTGETWLRKWVSECAPYAVGAGDSLVIEPGRLFSALLEELQVRIDADPTAHWSESTGSIIGSAFDTTPRLLAVAAFDPRYPPISMQNYVVARKVVVVFLESVSGSSGVTVRIVDSMAAVSAP
jgi:hypothetical protein